MKRIGVLGTGVVGQTIAGRLADLTYDVMVGARSADSDSLKPFASVPDVKTGSFADAAAHGELVINATNGRNSLAALQQGGADNLDGKTVLDVTNDLEPVEGGFPRPVATSDNSLGQRIQDAFPNARVVKALNTMNCRVMVDPSIVPGDHVVFLGGDDAGAKGEVVDVLSSFGWRPEQVLDLGGIDTAAATEMMMAVWMRVMIARGMGSPPFNWAINSGS
ncbi:MAG: NAD(P)-binding domain-containing protein [Nocardioidaceae bacterium]